MLTQMRSCRTEIRFATKIMIILLEWALNQRRKHLIESYLAPKVSGARRPIRLVEA